MMSVSQEPKNAHVSTLLIVVAAISASLLVGGFVGYAITYSSVSRRIDDLQSQLSSLPYQDITYFLDENVSLSQLYQQAKESIVVIRGEVVQYDIFHRPYYSEVQGSGFVYNFSGQPVIVTNYHVVQSAINITVTFADGNTIPASTLGSDPYEDLAVLSTDGSQIEWRALTVMNSATLEVGDPVVAIGTPYGLAGSMTVGVVSALGRTISEETTGGYPIASIIQTSTPINPGNSGGPLLNYQGEVVGITTAIVSDSQGLGFAIPSSAILREITSLVTQGSYDQHPSLGATGTDMTYEIAVAMNTNVTYGWLIATVSNQTGLRGGTSQVAIGGNMITIGGDIITALNMKRITSLDDLSTYLEEYTLPGQTIDVTVIRDNQETTIPVKLGARPLPSTT